jgi:hypothetical protein
VSTAVKEATAAFRVPGENRACGFRVTVLRATCQGDLPIGSQCAKANWQQLKRQRQRHNGPGALAEHRDFQLITGLGPGRLRVGCSHFQAVAPPAVPVASGSRVTRTLAGNYTSLVAPCHSAAVSGSESARMPVPVTVMEAGPRPVRAGQPRYRQDPEPEACPDRQPEDAGSRGTGGGCWPGAGRGRRAAVCQAAQRCQVAREAGTPLPPGESEPGRIAPLPKRPPRALAGRGLEWPTCASKLCVALCAAPEDRDSGQLGRGRQSLPRRCLTSGLEKLCLKPLAPNRALPTLPLP